jgi:hypothetical protein
MPFSIYSLPDEPIDYLPVPVEYVPGWQRLHAPAWRHVKLENVEYYVQNIHSTG